MPSHDDVGGIFPEEPTLRQSGQKKIASFLTDYGLISDPYTAQRTAESIIGTTRQDAPGMGIGLVDLTPGGLAFIPEDVKAETDKGNYGTASLVGGLSLLEAFPLTKMAAMPVVKFLTNVTEKASN